MNNGTREKSPIIFIHLYEDLALLQATYVQKSLNDHKSKIDLIDVIMHIYGDP